ncbi:hypothetical protein [Amycolatopsis sp. NPDC059021]|uniref:hypothetical protein n=1 Tax=Amycolatopsis sp. NPDC059021 TaxID=3346704 RepID=UPI00366EB825
MVTPDFELRLVDALEPIRGLALANALHALMDSGVYDTLLAQPGLSAEDLAARHGLAADRFGVLCHYLANEGYLAEDAGWALTAKARELAEFRPWYTLLVGGYAGTFAQLGATLKDGAPWADRDGAEVGAGSCGMSMIDVLPMAHRLLDTLPTAAPTIVDLGCGDAAFLVELVKARPGLRAVGFEPDAVSSGLAAERVEREGLTDRITIHRGRVSDVLGADLPGDGSVCFLTAFVLQEMLEQDGEAAVEALLRKVMDAHPAAHWLVVEVDHRIDDRRAMAHALARAYYNPYFLLHALTEQRLERREFWDALFARAGLEIAQLDHPDDRVDSTRFELGYLLRTPAGR